MSISSFRLPDKKQLATIFAAFVTMLIIVAISQWLTPKIHPLILVASTGASIILVFMLYTSPLSQPYPLLMGQFVGAVVGVSCAYLPIEIYLSAALCIGSCMLLMSIFKCAHPPGGATAMMPIIVGAETVDGYHFILFPVLLNMVILLLMAFIFHRWWLKNEYPSQPLPQNDPVHQLKDLSPLSRLGINQADLHSTLAEYDAYLDVNEKDLALVISKAQQKAYTRKFGEIRCVDIMSKDIKTVSADTLLEQAWALLRKHRVKLLPVINDHRQVIGIISLVDFLKRADLKNFDGMATRLERFIKGDLKLSDNPRLVQQIMASPAFTVNQDDLIASLVPLLSDKGLHHIPVVDEQQQLVGIVTQSDLIAALYAGSLG